MRQKSGNILLGIVFIIVVVLVGGYFIFQIRQDRQRAASQQEAVDQAVERVREEVGQLVVSDPNSLSGELEDVTGGNSTGTFYILRDSGALLHTVEAVLPEPSGDDFYEGWLVKRDPEQEFFSAGAMRKDDGGKYRLEYVTEGEFPNYNFVVITLETVKDDIPEKHILEGEAN